MKKVIYSFIIFSMMMWTISPALAIDGTTSFVRDSEGGNNPIVKVKWEMNAGSQGTDDSTAIGAQFMPSGQYQVNKTITVCAVVTDPDGVADLDAVYADVFYPENIFLGPDHELDRQGCGQLHGNEFSLTKMEKLEGIALICDNIRNGNPNLPVWNNDYDYDEICQKDVPNEQDGELWKETAYVYCGDKTLSYEDPSGEYRTLVLAQDKNGLDGILENYFKYMDFTAFEVDFDSVSYGSVKLNTHKKISGDLNFGTSDMPTVRNVGNTRLQMRVNQDDMELGKTDTSWNVKYDARVGSDAAFSYYYPEYTKTLNDALNLSQTNEMDFSIEIFKFPPEHSDCYTGTIILSATKADHLVCCTDC
ncbi:hypothetical protein K8R61_01050 [bacterium]|nr:hypothetical protein [bacterium]